MLLLAAKIITITTTTAMVEAEVEAPTFPPSMTTMTLIKEEEAAVS
jgi:hypothetical protein